MKMKKVIFFQMILLVKDLVNLHQIVKEILLMKWKEILKNQMRQLLLIPNMIYKKVYKFLNNLLNIYIYENIKFITKNLQ